MNTPIDKDATGIKEDKMNHSGIVAIALLSLACARLPAADAPLPVLDCIVQPSEIIDVGSGAPGVVEAVLPRRNERVDSGDIIARLESGVEQASAELARARAESKTEIRLRQATAAFGQRTQKRNQALRKTAAVSAHELDQSTTETRIAWMQVKQARENRHIAELEYQRALAALERRVIRSPVDGVVMQRFKSPGEYVDNEPLMRIARLNPLHVEVIVPVEYLGRIDAGMSADVTLAAGPDGPFQASVESVDRVADAASATYGVRLSLPNPDYRIPAGLRCRIEFRPTPPQRPLAGPEPRHAKTDAPS